MKSPVRVTVHYEGHEPATLHLDRQQVDDWIEGKAEAAGRDVKDLGSFAGVIARHIRLNLQNDEGIMYR